MIILDSKPTVPFTFASFISYSFPEGSYLESRRDGQKFAEHPIAGFVVAVGDSRKTSPVRDSEPFVRSNLAFVVQR